MDSVTRKKGKLARTIAKILHIRMATGIAPVERIKKIKLHEKQPKEETIPANPPGSPPPKDEELQNRAAIEALLAKLFASLSSVKAAYAELQSAQSPYNAEEIQSADQSVVSELRRLSELKQCYLKKQLEDPSLETSLAMAEIQENRSLMKRYEIMGKKLDSESKLKDSQITSLREKLEECNKQNRVIEKRLNSSGLLTVLDNLHFSGLNPTHFMTVLRHASKSVKSFVHLIITGMETAGWDFAAAAEAIEPGVVYSKPEHRCFAIESFVWREMLAGFQNPNFEPVGKGKSKTPRQLFFERFTEMKSTRAREHITKNPKSPFSRFCREKFLRLVHPKMESSFFGNLNQRNQIESGKLPETSFFSSFAEMARRVWLLHCLAFSFEKEALIFGAGRNSRFSEVYMECVADEDEVPDPRVAFTVVPGFRIGKTVIQSQVYLSTARPHASSVG